MNCQQGIVLVTALLYLLVVTFLVACAFSSGVLQTQMASHFAQENQAFEYAESALLMGEHQIDVNEATGAGKMGTKGIYKFIRQMNSSCGVFYAVDAVGIAGGSQVHLQSIVNFPQAGNNPCEDGSLHSHRVVWQQINE